MTKYQHGMDPEEFELMACLSEEAGEIAQIVGKSFRHVLESHHPDSPSERTNRMDVTKEIGDLLGVARILMLRESIDEDEVCVAMMKKMIGLSVKYTHHLSDELKHEIRRCVLAEQAHMGLSMRISENGDVEIWEGEKS